MASIEVTCTEKDKQISVTWNPPGLPDRNGNGASSLNFFCPYGFQGGKVICCYPYTIENDVSKRAPSWLLPIISDNYPNKQFGSLCPVYQQLYEEQKPT